MRAASFALILGWLVLGGCDGLAALGCKRPVVDRVPPELPAAFGSEGPALLIFSKTSGFRHAEAIPSAERLVRAIAEQHGWSVFATENAAVFNDEQLARVDVVFGNNCSGDNWTREQKAAFRRWVEGGGGYVGIHGAGGSRFEYWDWYQRTLVGARFVGHPLRPQFQEATLHVEDRSHPATRHLPETWVRIDEWYSFESNPRERGVRVLATLDESTYSPKVDVPLMRADLSMGDDHPIIWSHCVGQGRSLFSALGHQASAYDEPAHAALIAGGLRWAAGLEGDCSHPIESAG